MKSRLSMLVALGFTCALGSVSYLGCSSSSPGGGNTSPDTGVVITDDPQCLKIGTPAPLTNAGCDDSNQPPAKDRCNPPGKCGPVDLGDSKCSKDIPLCPTDTACMAAVKQSGNTLNFRAGRIRLWAPGSLLALENIAVTPFVNAACVDKTSGEGFSWLMQIDKTKNTITTGGSKKSTDHKTFSFLTGQKVDPGTLDAICPGFSKAGAAPIALDPVTASVTWNGNTFSTAMLQTVNIPIFDTDVATNPPVILPLQEAYMKNVTISADNNCIGTWDGNYYCGVSQGWTTDGIIIGKITADDADSVPVKKVGCQSLCALLVNDSSKTDSNGHCKKGADGKVIADIGDACVGGKDCKNAFALSATFGAYGISIDNTSTPPTDGGVDAAPETGSDAGTDASDAASGG